MSRRITILAVAACLLLAGCTGVAPQGGGGDGGESADLSASQQAASGASGDGGGGDGASQAGDGGGGPGDGVPDAGQRAIIKTGSMVVEVDNFSAARSTIADRVRERGGFVGGSDQRLHRSGNETWVTGHIVVRVPSDTYGETQALAADQGTVLSEETTTEDVTDQLVDLEARLENLRSRRDRLRDFYDEANSTEELLRIEEQLSEVQMEIERLEAQQRSLERQVAYSTIRIELQEPEPGIDQIRTQYHEQSLVAVFVGSVEDVVVFAQASLVTVAGALPWLAVAAVPALGLRRLLRGRSLPLIGRRTDSPATDTADSESADAETTEQSDESGTAETEEDKKTDQASDDESER
ncbi:DUF4349 domain-containing protein [Halomicroarcula sp. GCM10025709]|uniref:DUF4349 domain-containing protein n=1 Tax=Haloarcula TaxID=2237 RepID=UPI0024C2C145|nr:DUF4349 domain-containing protein [Halomicroarcula sp. YJ-61-S]